jgi:catechol 2,3-dioxygenase-like lactoylglutathione lyase family enzyme
MFERIDTFILRVRNLERARRWYEERLQLTATFLDDHEQLAVLGVGEHHSLTLWQLKPGETAASSETAGAYPVFGTSDARAAHAQLLRSGVHPEPIQDGSGIRFFGFRDPDGNRLEVCQVLPTAAPDAGAEPPV